MQPLQICIGPIIRIGRESWCLPYAGFFFLNMGKLKKNQQMQQMYINVKLKYYFNNLFHYALQQKGIYRKVTRACRKYLLQFSNFSTLYGKRYVICVNFFSSISKCFPCVLAVLAGFREKFPFKN